MANKNSNQKYVTSQEIDDLRNRLEWVDEERRKATRRISELEKQIAVSQRELERRAKRIDELEERIAGVTSQVSRLPQVDAQLAQFKDEIVSMLEQYDARRVRSEEEMERLRRVEQEMTARELGEIRKELPAIARLQNEMELRQAEEARLANLIGVLQNRFPPIESRIENWTSDLAYLGEAEAQNSRHITEIQTTLVEVGRRWDPIYNRLDILGDKFGKLEGQVESVAEAQNDLRQTVKSWAEQVQLGEYERNQRLHRWERMLEEQQDVMEGYAQQWITFSDQYKEAKMAVETLGELQEHLEQQQREAAELSRVEVSRMQTRWENFVTERNKRWKNFEVDIDQRLASSSRNERKVREQVAVIDDRIDELVQEHEKLRRVQTAQADAVKQFPRIWQEAVERTLANDPNRRRQPPLVQVRDDDL